MIMMISKTKQKNKQIGNERENIHLMKSRERTI